MSNIIHSGEKSTQNVSTEKPFNQTITNAMGPWSMQTYMNPYAQQLTYSQHGVPPPIQTMVPVQQQQPQQMNPMQQPLSMANIHQSQPLALYPAENMQLQYYQVPSQTYTPTQQFAPVVQPQDEWHRVQNKKRIRSPEELKARKQTKLTNYWLSKPLEVQNRFENLTEETETINITDETNKEESTNKEEENEPYEPKPPPITVYGVGYIAHLHEWLGKIAPKEYILKTTGSAEVKIQLAKGKHFKPVIEMLDNNKTQYHTYKPKTEKSFRVVVKGLHSSITTEDITTALEKLGHEVTNVWNIKHRITKQALPMHYVDIKTKDNNKSIYNIKELSQNVVKVEPPHVKRIIPQCTRCQSYGHTKNFCRKLEKCVKCAGNHNTKNCERKERDNNVKCINCNGTHPANYRGCIVHKQLQQNLYPALRKKVIPQIINNNTKQQLYPNVAVYQTPNIYNKEFPALPAQARMTYTQVASSDNTQQSQANHTINQATNQPSNDIGELKTLIKELIEQNRENARNMSTMLNLLTLLVNKLNNGSTN